MRAIAMLCQHACELWGINVHQLKGAGRAQNVAAPRQAIMYVAVKELGISTGIIAQALGRSDHTTIIHGCKAVLKRVDKDIVYKARVKALISFSHDIPEAAFLPDTRETHEARRALRSAAVDAVEQLLDLSAANPEAFRELLVDVMRGTLKKRVERLVQPQ